MGDAEMLSPGAPGSLLGDVYEAKVDLYRESVTPEVDSMVAQHLPQGGRLLDIGCGTGNLLGRFRASASFLAGIDVAATACEVARTVADVVVNQPIESAELPVEDHSFDVVVCADVLEHLVDPARGLARAVECCRAAGVVVISVPNIAYWHARVRLLRGIWTYEDVGIFDDGHLRFFTLDSLHDLVSAAGLEMVGYQPVLKEFWHNIRGFRRLPMAVQRPIERSWERLGRKRPSLLAYQHVCVCRPAA